MKRFASVIVVAAAMALVPVLAVDFEYVANDDGENTITLVGCSAYSGVGNLEIPSAYAGKTVTRIGEDFFRDGRYLYQLAVPATVRVIGKNAFRDCVNLTTVTFAEGVQSIVDGAFSGCCIADLNLPSTIAFVGEKAFTECPLTSMRVAGTENSFVFVNGGVLYSGASVWDDYLVAVTSLKSADDVNVIEGCTEIGANCFDHDDWGSSLRTIAFPSTLKKVGHDAFSGCDRLQVADFTGTRLKKLSGQDTFGECTSLTTVKFPATLKEICGHCFQNCIALTYVEFRGDAPAIIVNDDETESMLDQIYVWEPGKNIWTHLDKVVTYVAPGTVGWPANTWQGRPLYVIDQDPMDTPFGPYVPGERVTICLPELIGYSARGLPSGLRLTSKTGVITGIPKKPTGDTGVVVTFTKRGANTKTAVFIVDPIPSVAVTMEGDVENCKVSGGNKAYLAGKRVSLAARTAKGVLFLGWYADGAPWPSADTYLNKRIKFVMPAEDVRLVAKFQKEVIVIDASAVEGVAFKAGCQIAPGIAVIDVDTQSGMKSMKASGLPRGLKLSKDRSSGIWSISGKPKVAGAFVVTVKVTAKSGALEQRQFAITVAE